MQEWAEGLVLAFVEWTELTGYLMLLITVPLGILQGIVTIFPFATLFFLHVTSFGVIPGLMISGLIGSASSIVCFWLARSLLYEWFQRKFGRKFDRYEKWQYRINRYGGWAVLLLRIFPLAPSNLISIMAAISPMQVNTYVWSTTIGTFSHLWMLALLSSAVFLPEANPVMLWVPFALFHTILLIIFFLRVWLKSEQRPDAPTMQKHDRL